MVSSDDIKKWLAIINPQLYYEDDLKRGEFIKKVKKKGFEGFSKEDMKSIKAKALASYKFVFDGATSQLEPTYFWLLDFMTERQSLKVTKITDNFTSSPGSGHFGEIGMRATKMQEEGMKVLGLMNQVIKTIVNLVYDLKEFELRIKNYGAANSEDPKTKANALLALKQIWLDNVDMKKGNTGIKAMTFSQYSFATLLDGFMIANSPDEVQRMDINDRVKRLLEQRIQEFNDWRELSEKEINKRYNIEKSYLKTEIESLKLYASWARPYLKAAEDLRMKGFKSDDAALVNAFNTAMFELVVMGKKGVALDPKADGVPMEFLERKTKSYNAVIIISFTFRGLPQRISQRGDYGFGGKIDVLMDCYSLNDDELQVLSNKISKENEDLAFKLIEDATTNPLNELKEDLDRLLKDDKEKEKEDEKKKEKNDINPFSALGTSIMDLFRSSKKDEKKDKKDLGLADLKPDTYIEQFLRISAANSAKKTLYLVYDVYKKAHGQASSPGDFDSASPSEWPSAKNMDFFDSVSDSFNMGEKK